MNKISRDFQNIIMYVYNFKSNRKCRIVKLKWVLTRFQEKHTYFTAIGGSTSACSDVFSGVSAFSEAESKAIKDYFANSNADFISYLTVHSYGQMWLYPWGYTSALPNDYVDLVCIAYRTKKSSQVLGL